MDEFDQTSEGENASNYESDKDKTFGCDAPDVLGVAGKGVPRGWTNASETIYKTVTSWNANPECFERTAGGWYYFTVNFTNVAKYYPAIRLRGAITGQSKFAVTIHKKSDMNIVHTDTADFVGITLNSNTDGAYDEGVMGNQSTDGKAAYLADARVDKTGQAGSEWIQFTNSAYIPTTGEYVVKIHHFGTSADGPNNGMGIFNFMEKSIPAGFQQSQLEELKVYPNPSKNGFNIDLSRISDNASFEIINIAGQQIYSKTNCSGSIQRVLPNVFQEKGIYFLRVNSANKQKVQKLIVN